MSFSSIKKNSEGLCIGRRSSLTDLYTAFLRMPQTGRSDDPEVLIMFSIKRCFFCSNNKHEDCRQLYLRSPMDRVGWSFCSDCEDRAVQCKEDHIIKKGMFFITDCCDGDLLKNGANVRRSDQTVEKWKFDIGNRIELVKGQCLVPMKKDNMLKCVPLSSLQELNPDLDEIFSSILGHTV